MNINCRLKYKAPVQAEPAGIKRFKTENNENGPKKISFYVNRSQKTALAETTKGINITDTLNQKTQQKKLNKPATKIKEVQLSVHVTEPYERGRQAPISKSILDKVFSGGPPLSYTGPLAKKLKDPPKDSSRATGINRYAFETKVGSGTFGTVHKARDKNTLETVAIKRVFQDKKYKNRELEILRLLAHPNLIQIKDSFLTFEGEKEYLNVVMDYMPSSLYDSIQRQTRGKTEIPRLKLKVLAYQLFRGLLYLRNLSIAHRDIKPQNILVDDSTWKLLFCDFGSAKRLVSNEPNIAYICSRCYRAPELIFGNTQYNTQIDVWSVGCVIVEMITGEPLFRADSNIDQLVQIIRVLGTPTNNEMLEMNPTCDFSQYRFPKIGPQSWDKVLKRRNLGQQFHDLLRGLFQYSPLQRITPYDALAHPFFNELRQQETYMRLKEDLSFPDLFNFATTQQASPSQLRNLIPDWYR